MTDKSQTTIPAWKSPEHEALLGERQTLLDNLFAKTITPIERDRLQAIRSKLDDIDEQAANVYLQRVGAINV